MPKKKNPVWFYIVLILIPIFIIVLLEVVLQLSGYGKNLSQWLKTEENRISLNPDIAAKYFTNIENYPSSNNDSFTATKGNNTFRIFVLGGSSTAGFPYSPNGTFPRYLRDYLQKYYQNTNFEVINLGITAVNSYTVLDLIPGVIEKSADLIIIYAGHNEYYGALGVASTQQFGTSPNLIYLYLDLHKFKLFQLIKDMTTWVVEQFSEKVELDKHKTLMTGMASQKSIDFNSDLYNKGISQFETNLDNILSKIKEPNIPVMIGTLTSNILDQKPFISTQFDGNSAKDLFNLGRQKYRLRNYAAADSLLKLSRDFDGLRFRAPSRFNKIIKELSTKHNALIVDIEDEFNEESLGGIVGNNLMVDHLHPNLDGYRLMAKSFTQKIIANNLIENNSSVKLNSELDSIIVLDFGYSKLDSLIAEYRINNLNANWPFTNSTGTRFPTKPSYKINQLAYDVVYNNMNWREAHQSAYRWYLKVKDYQSFSKEIKVMLSQYPYKYDYYNYAAEKLLEAGQYNLAWHFLLGRYENSPDAFSTKWIGNIYLKNKMNDKAVYYFKKSLELNPNDIQTLYNAGLAYYRMNQNESAKKYFQTCLVINPNHKSAKALLQKLK